MQKRPPGTQISEKGTQLAPLASKFDIRTLNGRNYRAQDVLSLAKPIQLGQLNHTPVQSVLSGDPNTPELMSTGSQLTVIDHVQAVKTGNPKAAKRRPKNSVRSNNSSFISRGVISEHFHRRFKPEDLSDCLVVTNYDRTVVLMDFSNSGNKIQPLFKLFFAKEWPLCHAFNPRTAGPQQLDMAVGMSSGDLVWLDLVSQRYERINKHHQNPSAILALQWIPHADCLVAAAHADGTLIIYDLHAEEPVRGTYNVGKLVTSLTFLSANKVVITFRGDYTKILDLNVGKVCEYVPSLFGGVFCLSLSPDGKYWACGGDDDIVSIYEVETRNLVVRLMGHRAWVRSISWDDTIICDTDRQSPALRGGTAMYRLASLGEDRQVVIWDFSPAIVTPPTKRNLSSGVVGDQQYVSKTHSLGQHGEPPIVYGRVLRYQSSTIFPVASTQPEIPEYGDLSLSSIALTSNSLILGSKEGRFFTWKKEIQVR